MTTPPTSARRQDLSAVPLLGKKVAPAGSGLVLAEWTADGSQSGEVAWQAPPHIHHEDDEAWYVLEGRLRLRIDGEDYDAPTGSAVVGPRGIPHTFGNPDPEPARYVLVMSARTNALLEALHSGEWSGPDAIRELFETYGCTLLDD